MFEQILAQLSVVAIFAKRFVDLLKPVYQSSEKQALIDQLLATAVTIALCVGWNLDLLTVAGLHLPVLVGELFTGVVASLGSSVLNDVLYLLKLLKGKTEG